MHDGYIRQQIRRCNRNLLLSNALILAGVVLATCASWRYLINFALGPVALEKRDLHWNLDVNKEPFYHVTVAGDKVLDTGFREISREVERGTGKVRNERTTAHYVALVVDGRLLIVKSSTDQPGTTLTGSLEKLPSDVRTKFLFPVQEKQPELANLFLPYMLDSTGFRGAGYWGLGIGLPLLALALWNLIKVFGRMTNPERHPIARAVEHFGPLDEVDAAISAEVQQGGNLVMKTTLVTPSWLLAPSWYGLQVIPVQEVLWVYRKVTNHSVNFVPTGKTHAAVICHHHGVREVEGGEGPVQRLVEGIFERAPWILVGFDQELQGLWNHNAHAVYQVVEDRRKQYLEMGERGENQENAPAQEQ